MEADGDARCDGLRGGDEGGGGPPEPLLLPPGGLQLNARGGAASSWAGPLSQPPPVAPPPVSTFPYVGSYEARSAPPQHAPTSSYGPQPPHGTPPSTGSTWDVPRAEAMLARAATAAATAASHGLGPAAAPRSSLEAFWPLGVTPSQALMATALSSAVSAPPPASHVVGASGVASTPTAAPQAHLGSPGASWAPPPPAPRPERDNSIPFYSQLDDLVARLPPGERPRVRAVASGAASSRRPPPSPADPAAAVAAAAAARLRATKRRRQAESRRAGAQCGPLTEAQTAAAGLAGQPETTPAAAVALASGLSSITAGLATAAAAGGNCSCAPLLVQVVGVLNGFLESHVQERQATTADFLSMRKGMALLLSNSAETKDEVSRIHELANSTALSVERVAASSTALAYNTSPAVVQTRQRQDDHRPPANTPGVSQTPSTPDPVEAPWAIPLQVCASSVFYFLGTAGAYNSGFMCASPSYSLCSQSY